MRKFKFHLLLSTLIVLSPLLAMAQYPGKILLGEHTKNSHSFIHEYENYTDEILEVTFHFKNSRGIFFQVCAQEVKRTHHHNEEQDKPFYNITLYSDHAFDRTHEFIKKFKINESGPKLPKTFTTLSHYYHHPDFKINHDLYTFLFTDNLPKDAYYTFYLIEETQKQKGYGDHEDDRNYFWAGLAIVKNQSYTSFWGSRKIQATQLADLTIKHIYEPLPSKEKDSWDYSQP